MCETRSMTSCWCLYCIVFKHCSDVSIVDFEQVHACWDIIACGDHSIFEDFGNWAQLS